MLTGSVGTGKTMLLDLFYQSLPVKKQRIHYHAFLLSLYRKVFVALEQQRLALDNEDRDLQRLASQRKDFRWDRKEENKANALAKGWRTVSRRAAKVIGRAPFLAADWFTDRSLLVAESMMIRH